MIPKNLYETKALLFLSAISLPQILLADTPGPGSLQSDFSKTALPILRQSCFACHGPKPIDTDDIQNLDQRKNTAKLIADAQKVYPMGETFPFPGSLKPKLDLKQFSDSLQKNWMPPGTQKTLNLGRPLRDQAKKNLLDWAQRAAKMLDQNDKKPQ